MPIPPQLLMAAAQMLKNRKSTKDRIKEALAPATDVLKNDIAPLVGMGADAGMMYNLRAEDPSMRTGIATGAIGSAAKGFQANGITGLITGGIMGGVTGAIATGNAKEQKAEQDKYTYLNQMYSSVVGADTNLQSALMYAEDGGEIVSEDGETFVPIQTEAKKIGKKLVKEKFIFSDGKIADVNATKPHSEQKKDDVTDITVEGTYVMPVSTKLNKKDLDSLISYSTSNYSENGKNFAVEKITLRDILGEKFEGSFAEATDIVTKKYPVMDTDDDLDPIARITNNENIANRSKIIAHLMRLNEAKINKEPIEEVKLTPSIKAKTGGFVKKYVLGSTVSGDPTKPKTALEKKKEKYDANKPKPVNQYSIRVYEPDSKAKKIYKTLVAPISAIDNKPGTSYDDPSGLDVALGVVNPFAWIDSAATVLKSTKDIVTGEGQVNDYATVGVSAAGAALGLRGSKAKGIGDKISKFMNNMYNPAAGVSLKKVDVPTPTSNIETPEGFQNRVFDSNVQLGQYSGKGHLSEAGYNYRVLSPAEIDAIAETRGVFPRVGKQKGGNENTKYWTKGNEKNWYGDKANLETIRVKQDRFSNDKVVLADDVEVFNKQTGKFEPLSAIKPTPKMTKGGFVSKYVLKPEMSLMKGGYIRKMAVGGGVGDPPGKKYKSAKGTIIIGDDGKYYFGKQDGSYIEANPQTVEIFTNQLAASKNPSGGENPWLLVEGTKGKPVLSANPAPQQPRPEVTVANDLDPSLRDANPIYSQEPINILGNAFNPSGSLVPRKKINIPALPSRTNPVLKSLNTPEISSLIPTDVNSITDQMMTPSDTEPIDQFRDVISERKGDAVRDAEEAKLGYKALSKRVGMRDLMQLGTGLVGIGLQDRTERRAFKRPLFMDQKYRGLSPQQINQQAEAGVGAGVEAIKQMMNGGGDRVTARLAPILIDRLISQQGQTRKAYVDQNTALERAKYSELGAIQQANLDEEARAKNVERDFNNKEIAGSTSLINKYISSTSAGDIEGYKAMKGIEEDKIRKIYDLENQGMQVDMIDKEYEIQMSDLSQKITDMEAQLMDPNMTFDEASKKSLEFSIARDKENLKNLEERQKKSKIRQNINGQ